MQEYKTISRSSHFPFSLKWRKLRVNVDKQETAVQPVLSLKQPNDLLKLLPKQIACYDMTGTRIIMFGPGSSRNIERVHA